MASSLPASAARHWSSGVNPLRAFSMLLVVLTGREVADWEPVKLQPGIAQLAASLDPGTGSATRRIHVRPPLPLQLHAPCNVQAPHVQKSVADT